MITKQEIEQRGYQIAEEKHAYSVFRDIVARENDRPKYEKRWFWELLQNAIDSVEKNEKVKVKIEISDHTVSFSHSGNPFNLDDILSLIIQGSSKPTKEGMAGRFGTGFMTTYLLSKKVEIAGSLTNKDGSFKFLLDRDADDPDSFYTLQKDCNEHFQDSFQEESYLINTDYQTRFVYNIDERSIKTRDKGLASLNELIPFTIVFNEKIESITIIQNGSTKTFVNSAEETINLQETIITKTKIDTIENDVISNTVYAYKLNDDNYDSCILTKKTEDTETILNLDVNYPKLFYIFPLIGSEEFGIPFVINSIKYDPRIEREGIYLYDNDDESNENVQNNKALIELAVKKSSELLIQLAIKQNFSGMYEFFNYLQSNLSWVDNRWLNELKISALNQILKIPCIHQSELPDTLISVSEFQVPYTEKKELNDKIYELSDDIISFHLPAKAELPNWIRVFEAFAQLKEQEIYQVQQILSIKKLINLVEEQEEISKLKILLRSPDNVFDWLDNLNNSIATDLESFPLDKKVLLNQSNKFRTGEGMSWDLSNDDTLNDISSLIGLNYENFLIHRKISHFEITGISDFSLEQAISKIKNSLNDLQDNDYSNEASRTANAKFLKWLISKNKYDLIKDLKIITIDKKSDATQTFILQVFPNGKHLLLPPKDFFKNEFPYYSNLVRDKDCLHPIYNEFLNNDDFSQLANQNFIHISPVVIRKEIVDIKGIELLISNPDSIHLLKDEDGAIKQKIELEYSDFAYLTATEGHIYDRNTTSSSSLQRFRFMLLEALMKDPFFNDEQVAVNVENSDEIIYFNKSMWLYRAKQRSWVNVKNIDDNTFSSEIPSSKNLSDLIKDNDELIQSIKGDMQIQFLTKLGIGISDLIRNTLPSDEVRLNWDKAFAIMITSGEDPELVQEIFKDPNIKKEYQARIKARKLISRNQDLGALVEQLFTKVIEELKKSGININIDRKPFGSDYILTDESSDFVNENNEREVFSINNWLIELKATGKNYALMTDLQAHTAVEQKDNYALIVVPLDGSVIDFEFVKNSARVVTDIGIHLEDIIKEFDKVDSAKVILRHEKDGVSVDMDGEQVRFRINSIVWDNSKSLSIREFVLKYFNISS